MFNSKGVMNAKLKELLNLLQDELVRWTERSHADCAEFSGVALNIRGTVQCQPDMAMHLSLIITIQRNSMI